MVVKVIQTKGVMYMRTLDVIMKEVFREYLESINIPVRSNMKLSEMTELIRNNNSSNSYRPVGMMTKIAIEKFESQF